MVETNNGSANNAGSPSGSVNTGSPIDLEQYKNLEKAFGTQGQELGEFRQFFSELSPLLEKLDKNPELTQAIVEGKIDSETVKGILNGTISATDAKIISDANDAVQKNLGKKNYNETDNAKIEKMVADQVNVIKKELEGKIQDSEDTRKFEAKVNDFIAKKADFPKYAEEIEKYLDDHGITDIEVAYYAVKGKLSEEDAKTKADADAADAAKDLALNVNGGGSKVIYSGEDAGEVIDSLIAGRSNPNIFKKG